MTFETADGRVIRVLEASHTNQVKETPHAYGIAVMSVLVQHLIQTTVEEFEQAIIETVPAQYLYKVDDTAYFMNTETYDQCNSSCERRTNCLYILENSSKNSILRKQ